MDDKGLLYYIWDTKANRVIIIVLVIVISTAILSKFLIWNDLTLIPFVFFGIVIPFQLLFINSIPYKLYGEWLKIQKTYSGRIILRKGVQVHIRNFWPWAEMTKLKNMGRALDMPYYDFDKADILESKDLIVVRGYSENLFLGIFKPKTRPFAIILADTKVKDSNLYQVHLTSVNETTNFNEFTFIDNVVGTNNPITIKIYKDK